jgi:c-di-GMP-binding flagellar brake protein YcgR
MDDRRKFQRVSDANVEIQMCALEGKSTFDANLKDVSIGGIKVRTNEAVEMYGFYKITIRIYENNNVHTVEAEGKVWRIEPDTEINDNISRFVALEFTSFADGNKALFSKFLAGFALKNEWEEKIVYGL